MEVPKYLSAAAYAKASGLGEAEVKKMVKNKYLDGYITQGGQFKIAVYPKDLVPKEKYEEVLRRAIEAETRLETIFNTIKPIIERK